MRRLLQRLIPPLSDIYNTRDDYAKGRLISLISSLMTSFYNVFITGIFYTGFLSMYGISITGVGIVSLIPYLSGFFAPLSPFVLKKLKRRKAWMLGSKILFYGLYIVATTLMPLFVTDPDARLVWFIILLFVAYSEYALFSSGITTWFYEFYPKDNRLRTDYIYYNQFFSSVLSSLVLLLSSFLTDAVAGSPNQHVIILAMRYLAFVLVIIEVTVQAFAKDFSCVESDGLRLKDIFVEPVKNRKFMMCMLLMFIWNFMANFNNGTWNYHLLNHMQYPYSLINGMSVLYTVVLALTSKLWRKLINRFGWVKTFGLCNLVWLPTEIMYFMMNYSTRFLYVPLAVWQNIISVGFNLSYANILYMNLPRKNSTAFISFYNVGANLCALAGMALGTWIVSLHPDTPFTVGGFEVYTVQFTCLMRALFHAIIAFMCVAGWRKFTSDEDAARLG